MAVFVNHAAEPVLNVPSLLGPYFSGGIAFKGPAIFANLAIRAHDASVLPRPGDTPSKGNAVEHWWVAPPRPIADTGPLPAAASIPTEDAWRPIEADESGRVDLDRAFAEEKPSAAWLRTTIVAANPVRRTLRLGWLMQVVVFLNNRQVFAGENPYRPVARRINPDGRLEADNASIALDLAKGANAIVLAVGNRWLTGGGIVRTPYGWGIEAHLDQIEKRCSSSEHLAVCA